MRSSAERLVAFLPGTAGAVLAASGSGDRASLRAAFDQLLVSGAVAPELTALLAGVEGRRLLPELAALAPDGQVRAGRHKDNLAHSIAVAAQAPPRVRVRWAALLHDVGKALTRKVSGSSRSAGKVSFQDHERVGAALARARLLAFGYDRRFADDVARLVEVSGRIASFGDDWSDSAVRRFACDAGPLLDDALDLVAADCTSRFAERRLAAAARVALFRERFDAVCAADAARSRRPPLDGAAVMDLLGLEPGPEVGVALRWLLENFEGADPGVAAAALAEWWMSQTPG